MIFSIDDNTGDIRFLVNESTEDFVDSTSIIKRASHVVPWNPVLRVFFRFLRLLWGEKGLVPDWTRSWSCRWQINLSPVGGPIIPVEWASRQSAIDFEIQWLEQNFL